MKNCFCCKEELTKKNKSKEHIIPNSIGGKDATAKFCCKKCNENNPCDAIFAKKFELFTALLGIKTRSESSRYLQIKCRNNEQVNVSKSGKLSIEPRIEKKSENNYEIKCWPALRNVNEQIIKQMFYRKGIIGKNTKINEFIIKYGIKNQTKNKLKVEMILALDFDLKSLSGSLIKTLQSLLAENDRLILDDIDFSNISFKYYYGQDGFLDHEYQSSPCHIVLIQSSKIQNELAVYIEYFSLFKVGAIISFKSAKADDFSCYCAINLQTQEPINNLDFDLFSKNGLALL